MSARILTRTTLRPLHFAQTARYASTASISSRTAAAMKGDWGAQWKRVGGSALMYFPVVAVVMFWPYAIEPIHYAVEKRS